MTGSSSFNHVFPSRFAHVKRCGIICIDQIKPMMIFKPKVYHGLQPNHFGIKYPKVIALCILPFSDNFQNKASDGFDTFENL